MIELPLDNRHWLPTHLHLHGGVRAGAGLEPGAGVQVQPGWADDGEVHRSRLSDPLMIANPVMSTADILSIILEMSLYIIYLHCHTLKYSRAIP